MGEGIAVVRKKFKLVAIEIALYTNGGIFQTKTGSARFLTCPGPYAINSASTHQNFKARKR
jgi:hypothetical protein